MVNLKMFKMFESFQDMYDFCSQLKERSVESLVPSESMKPIMLSNGRLGLSVGQFGKFRFNNWSFSQLCRLAHFDLSTVNRLSPENACKALFDNFYLRAPNQLKVLTTGDQVRAIQSVEYKRVFNADILDAVRTQAPGYGAIPKSSNGETGLFAGEQGMFCFLTAPKGWIEVEGDTFTPGFHIWNTEVGHRLGGIDNFRLWTSPADMVRDTCRRVNLDVPKMHEPQDVLRTIKEAVTFGDQQREAYLRSN